VESLNLLFSGYTYDGPTPGPEIALEKDHAKRRLFNISGQKCVKNVQVVIKIIKILL
jgi:hypothetical protein